MNRSCTRCILFLASLLLPFSSFAATKPMVVTSIQPVYLLAAAVTQGVTEPHLLVKQAASPHQYTLTPEDASTLANADIIFYISPSLETFLEKPMETLSPHAAHIALMEEEGIKRLPYRDHVLREGSVRTHYDTEEQDHRHEGGYDPHIWLDPANAKAMLDVMVSELSRVDPGHKDTYKKNADATLHAIAEADARIGEKLHPYADTPYLVFHDGYRYFEGRYGLHSIGALTFSPERPLGAKTLQDVSTLIKTQSVVCLFSEPQFPSAAVNNIAESLKLRTGVLDPLGMNAHSYPEILEGIADAMVSCFHG